MNFKETLFRREEVLHRLKHFLPAQAPLKDFIHHNTLHAFQEQSFHEALNNAARLFGYTVYLSLSDYRKLYASKLINDQVIDRILDELKKEQALD